MIQITNLGEWIAIGDYRFRKSKIIYFIGKTEVFMPGMFHSFIQLCLRIRLHSIAK